MPISVPAPLLIGLGILIVVLIVVSIFEATKKPVCPVCGTCATCPACQAQASPWSTACSNYNGGSNLQGANGAVIYNNKYNNLQFASSLTQNESDDIKSALANNYFGHCGSFCVYSPSGQAFVFTPSTPTTPNTVAGTWGKASSTTCNFSTDSEVPSIKARFPTITWKPQV